MNEGNAPMETLPEDGNVSETPAARPDRKRQRQEQRALAWSLRVAGASYRQIAAQLSVSLKKAFELCKAELREQDRVAGEDMAHRKKVQLAQLERGKAALAPKIASGDIRAVETLTKLVDLEAKLIGSHAPLKHMVAAKVHNTFDLDRNEMDVEWLGDRGKKAAFEVLNDQDRVAYLEAKARLKRRGLPPDMSTPQAAALVTDAERLALSRFHRARSGFPVYESNADRLWNKRHELVGALTMTVTLDGVTASLDRADFSFAATHQSGGAWPPPATSTLGWDYDYLDTTDDLVIEAVRCIELVDDPDGPVNYGTRRMRSIREHRLIVDPRRSELRLAAVDGEVIEPKE
jgi:hypothetical protein